MKLGRIYARMFTITARCMCAIFFLCLLATSFTGTWNSRYGSVSIPRVRSNLTEVQSSVMQAGKTSFFTEFNGNEILSDLEYKLTVNRNIQNLQNNMLRIFNLIIPFMGLGVLLYYYGYVIKKKKKIIPVMATSLGGHAPPQSLSIKLIS